MPGYRESVVDCLLEHAVERPGAAAVADTGGEKLSYEELLARASRIARLLVERYGVEPGAKIAVGLENTVASAAVLFGVWLAGGVAVVVDPLSFEEDLRVQFEQSRPVLVVGDEQGFERICGVAGSMGLRCVGAGALYKEAGGGGVWEGYVRPRGWMDALVYFYAGIAGRTLETFHAHSGVAASAALTAAHFGLGVDDSVYVTPPLSHALGLQIGLLSALWAGGSALLLRRRGRLEPGAVAESLVSLRPSMVVGAPMLYSSLLEAGYRGHEGLRIAVSAGAPLPVEVQRRWRSSTGVELLQLYGMTEAAPVSATRPGDNPEASIGRPMPGVEVRVVDPEDPGRAVEGVGELLVRGPMVMRGYGDPAETERAFYRGWLRTGDLVEVRGGHLYFRGVRKRMLKYKGYPIFPRDLELLLERHPAVERAEVYGEPVGELGQVPVAKVWLRPGSRVDAGELLEWVNRRVAPYKRLRRVEIVG